MCQTIIHLGAIYLACDWPTVLACQECSAGLCLDHAETCVKCDEVLCLECWAKHRNLHQYEKLISMGLIGEAGRA